ncbi:MAG: phosphoenolpyruvate--protein phosphotransferase [bacterium]|nr:phosphoenolpyruvate--protein phosphotransferase [bacterium]
MRNKIIRGIPASPGIIITKAVLYEEEKFFVPIRESKGKAYEISKFELAQQKTKEEILVIQQDFLKKTDASRARILEAQFLVLEDKTLIDGTIDLIKKGDTAEAALEQTTSKILYRLNKIEDEYLKARISDIKDVTTRLMRNLTYKPKKSNIMQTKHSIIAEELTPSEIASLSDNVIAIATDLGGENSHTAIMARAIGMPAVMGLKEATKLVNMNDTVIIDGNQGVLIIDPDEATLRTYDKKIKRFQQYGKELKNLISLPAETLDGNSIDISCNIDVMEEVDLAIQNNSAGVGLLRTEFLYLTSKKIPNENEQYKIYNYIAEKMYPNSVVIRTLDIGGDKLTADLKFTESNPFLGCRGIRYSLANKKLFIAQIKAILRASQKGNVRILLPMVSEVKELILAKFYIEIAKTELKNEKIAYDPNIGVGVMIEVPAAAIVARPLAQEADFLSIGSNDLFQYTLACDRTNPKVNCSYNPLQPAVFQLIKSTIEQAHKSRKWVSCCGELAAEPIAIPILIGMGVDVLSVAPIRLLEVKKIVRSLSMKEAKEIATKALEIETITEMETFINEVIIKIPAIREILKERGGTA